MAHAENCPICGSSGKVKKDDGGTAAEKVPCHGCGGKGWVEVSGRKIDHSLGLETLGPFSAVYIPPPSDATIWKQTVT